MFDVYRIVLHALGTILESLGTIFGTLFAQFWPKRRFEKGLRSERTAFGPSPPSVFTPGAEMG